MTEPRQNTARRSRNPLAIVGVKSCEHTASNSPFASSRLGVFALSSGASFNAKTPRREDAKGDKSIRSLFLAGRLRGKIIPKIEHFFLFSLRPRQHPNLCSHHHFTC